MSDDITRPFPHAVGPEKSILSSMLQDPQEFIPAAIDEGLTAAHFYLPNHAILFDVISDKFRTGEVIELVSLAQNLNDCGKLDQCGGPSAISDVYTYAAGSAHFRHHLEMVRSKYVMRSILNLCSTTTDAVFNSPDEVREALAEFERGVTAIAAIASGSEASLTTLQILRESFEEFERRMKGGEGAIGLPTFPALDRKIRGLHPGRMYVPGAYPEGGKSTFCSEIIANLVISGVPCAYLPLEGTEKDLMTRMIIQAAGIPAQAYTDPMGYARENGGPEMSKMGMQRIQRAIQALAKAPLHIRRPQGNKLTSIISIIRRFHREHGIKVVVIDYAQRIKGSKSESREIEQTECSNAIQTLAGELGIAIIVPSQLNDDGDTKHGKVWQEDADVVLRIVQDRNKESDTYKMHRYLAIDKDRHNGSGGQSVGLILDREHIKFVEGEDKTESSAKKPKWTR